MKTTPRTNSPWLKFKGVWGACLVVVTVAASSCDQRQSAPRLEPASVALRTTRQGVNSTDKVLILGSSVSGGLASREAQAVASLSPSTQIDVVTPEQWKALTAQQFMAYRALIIGDAACQSGTAAFQAAIESRTIWGIIVDGDVAFLSTDPTHNHTELLVENGIQYVLNSIQFRTGMYIALGCAFQDAQAPTPVPLLEPFGTFQVQGVPGCADAGHMFEMKNNLMSQNFWDGLLSGDGCVARSVFTTYPDHDFSFAALAMRSSGASIPGQRLYVDFTSNPENETPFTGTPYLLVRGAETLGAGCGLPESTPDEQCDLGDNLNGAPALKGQHPWNTCSYSCHLNWCGDGFVDSSQGEECDNGIDNGRTGDASGSIGTCTLFCKLATLPPPLTHPPRALCQDVTTVAEYTCGVPASIDNGSYDPDSDLVGCMQAPEGPYPIGTSTVTLTCVDQQGHTDACTSVVTVLDHVAPTITLHGSADPSLECTLGGRYNDPGASANDPCDGPLPVVRSGQVKAGVPETYELLYKATDPAGNSALPVKRRVAVTDTLAPNLVLTGLAHEALECGTPYVDPGATAMDQCAGSLTQEIIKSGSVNANVPGTYTLGYNVKDPAGHEAERSRIITVADTLPPSILLNEPLNPLVECGSEHYADPGASASDACAGELPAVPSTAVDPSTPGRYSISYSATDPSGNTSTSSTRRTVTVSDTLPPSLVLQGADALELECGSPFNDPGATAFDQCAGDLTSAIAMTGVVNSAAPGGYTLTYSVADPSGHDSSVRRLVNVRDTLPPSITLRGPLALQVECGATYRDPGAEAFDACAGDVSDRIRITGDVDPDETGSYAVSYSVSDPSGLTATTGRAVTVVDTKPPSIRCPEPITTQVLEADEAIVTPAEALATDTCDTAVQVSHPSETRFPVGITTLKYTATDAAGNTASCTSTVTVENILRPDTWIVSAPPDETEDTNARFEFAASKPQVTYECSLEGHDFTECSQLTTFSDLSEGPHQLLVRARDALGNVDPTPASSTWKVLPPLDLDSAVLGGGNGCAAASGEPSVLAMVGLVLVLLRRKGRRSRRSYLTWARLFGLGVPLLGTTAVTQPRRLPPFEMERLSLNPSGTGSLVLGTGELLPDGTYRFSVTGHYENDPLVYVQNGERLGTVVQYRTTAHMSAAYGVKDKLELGVQLPLLLRQRGDDLMARGLISPDAGPALGTPMLTLRWKLLSEHQEDPMDLSVGVQAGPRLGRATALARELRAIPSVMVGRRYGFLRAALDIGVLLRTRSILTPDTKIQDELGNALRLGAVLATTGEGLRGELTFIAAVPLRREGHSVEALAGLRLPLSASLEAYGLAGVGYGNAPGTPDFRFLFGVAYAHSSPVCLVGSRHTLEECPDLDDDDDGLRNRDDDCPVEAGPVDNRGCPLQDSDGDGLEDKADLCPSVAGLTELRGCPDVDHAGAEDAMDWCSNAPGVADHLGCPPVDSDGDGVPDALDNCSDRSGPSTNEGCPENEKQWVAIQPDRLAIKDTIHFEFNKAIIQARSFPLLNQVAHVLQGHRALGSLTIEGYTDDLGPENYNLGLSQRRAQAVLEYLVRQGVARERMTARGFGENHPVQTNATPEGRAANRRVEFKTHPPEEAP